MITTRRKEDIYFDIFKNFLPDKVNYFEAVDTQKHQSAKLHHFFKTRILTAKVF